MMVFLSWKDRRDRVAARCAERLRGDPVATEAAMAGYLHAMRMRGEDVKMTLRECEPPARYDFEEDRLQQSREWMRRYLHG